MTVKKKRIALTKKKNRTSYFRHLAETDPTELKKVGGMGAKAFKKNFGSEKAYKKHMSDIGKKGGHTVSRDAKHMSAIGKMSRGIPKTKRAAV